MRFLESTLDVLMVGLSRAHRDLSILLPVAKLHGPAKWGIATSTRGIFGCFSTAMSEDDLDAFVAALDASLSAMA